MFQRTPLQTIAALATIILTATGSLLFLIISLYVTLTKEGKFFELDDTEIEDDFIEDFDDENEGELL